MAGLTENVMHRQDCSGCEEYRDLSRRQFLSGSTSLALAGMATAPAWLPRVAYAGEHRSDRDVIVSIFLRGGADGLTLCVPHGDNGYYNLRPDLAVPQPDSGGPQAATDLDGFFGLAPGMAALAPAFAAGDLAIVHACGMREASRSHFDAQRFVEVGEANNPSMFTGWLGRHLLSAPPLQPGALLRALSLGFAVPRSLIGGPQTLPVPDPGNYDLAGRPGTRDARLAYLAEQYAQVDDPVRAAAGNVQATIDLLAAIDFENYTPGNGAVYEDNEFGRALRAAAALIRAEVGVEAISVDLGGWDTHDQQGPIDGALNGLMRVFANNLAAFHADVGSGDKPVTTVAVSEFGRTAAQNGSLGTDHGFGNCMFALGPSIAGGQVLTQWPGLSPGQLFENRDLDITIDYRDILAEIVQNRLGNPDLAAVFPAYAPVFQGVTQ